MYDVVVVTENRFINLTNPNWYEKQVIQEDEFLLESFKKVGLKTQKVSWTDPFFDWSQAKKTIIRTTWDYFYKQNEFKNWIEHTKNRTEFVIYSALKCQSFWLSRSIAIFFDAS